MNLEARIWPFTPCVYANKNSHNDGSNISFSEIGLALFYFRAAKAVVIASLPRHFPFVPRCRRFDRFPSASEDVKIPLLHCPLILGAGRCSSLEYRIDSWPLVPVLIMPTESLYPILSIPKQDIFGFLFERNRGDFPDRPFPDDKGTSMTSNIQR